MKKTNIRLNNFFLLESKSEFYITNIDDLDSWKNMKAKDLKQFLKKENEKTSLISKLLVKYNKTSNINFIQKDINDNVSSPKKDLRVIKLQSGGE
jgi:hypothetical protein